jgi:uncharacterized protein (DUF934 family)
MPTLIDLSGTRLDTALSSNGELADSQVVQFKGDQDPLTSEIDWKKIARVEIDFPNFTDGRGYSIARLVRTRLNFAGEIRAIGDVLVDQLPYMARCGFTSFALRDDQSVSVAQRTLKAFSLSYQASHPVLA